MIFDTHTSRILAVAATVIVLLPASSTSAQSVTGRSSAGLFYEVSGAGEPIVFIHGFSLDRRMWEPQVTAFEARYRVIRYDLRGHGDSVASLESYTGYGDLLNVLDALEISRAVLVGLSAGSELAINFAITHPDRVARLVLASPGLGGFRGSLLPWMQPVLDSAAAGDGEGAARLWVKTPLMRLVGDVGAGSVVTAMVMRNARLWTSRRTEQPLSPPAIGRLSAITCPVLVIVGDEDQPHILEMARVITEGVAGATRTVIPSAGHLVNLDAPVAFNGVVRTFLAKR